MKSPNVLVESVSISIPSAKVGKAITAEASEGTAGNNLKLDIAEISVLSAPFFQAIDFPEYKNETAIVTKTTSTTSTERQIIRLFLFIFNGLSPFYKFYDCGENIQ
jgi:hypothetical protein